MIQYIHWGGSTPTGLLVEDFMKDDLYTLQSFIIQLDASGYDLITVNTQGIVIKDRGGIVSPDIANLEYSLKGLEDRVVNIETKPDPGAPPPIIIEKSEVDGFHIMFDLLPEHIKRELKIYIK